MESDFCELAMQVGTQPRMNVHLFEGNYFDNEYLIVMRKRVERRSHRVAEPASQRAGVMTRARHASVCRCYPRPGTTQKKNPKNLASRTSSGNFVYFTVHLLPLDSGSGEERRTAHKELLGGTGRCGTLLMGRAKSPLIMLKRFSVTGVILADSQETLPLIERKRPEEKWQCELSEKMPSESELVNIRCTSWLEG